MYSGAIKRDDARLRWTVQFLFSISFVAMIYEVLGHKACPNSAGLEAKSKVDLLRGLLFFKDIALKKSHPKPTKK